MKLNKLIALLLVVVLAVGMMAACGKKEADKPVESKGTDQTDQVKDKEPEKEPVKETPKKLTVYCGLMEDLMVKAVAQFEKETGIKTEAVRMSSGEILARIRAEKDNPSASVWYGGPADAFIQAKEEGLLEAYISPNASVIPDKYKDAEGFWTGIYVGYLGFSSNAKLLQEKGVEAPVTWEDLLKPEFKGQISIANPASSGTAYTCLATIVQLMGEEKGLDYMKKLHGQVKNYEKSGTAPARMAGQGEVMVGITFLHDGIKYKEEGMTDLVLTAPSEGTGYEIGALGIIKDGPDQDAAKIFIDWYLTKEVQEIGQTVGSYQFLTHPEAKTPEMAKSIEGTKLIDYDFDWAGKSRNELVEKWSEAIK